MCVSFSRGQRRLAALTRARAPLAFRRLGFEQRAEVAERGQVECPRCFGDFVELAAPAETDEEWLHVLAMLDLAMLAGQPARWAVDPAATARAREAELTARKLATINALPAVRARQHDLDGDGECAICAEEWRLDDELLQLPCGHLFHAACIRTWLLKACRCPLCQRDLPLAASTAPAPARTPALPEGGAVESVHGRAGPIDALVLPDGAQLHERPTADIRGDGRDDDDNGANRARTERRTDRRGGRSGRDDDIGQAHVTAHVTAALPHAADNGRVDGVCASCPQHGRTCAPGAARSGGGGDAVLRPLARPSLPIPYAAERRLGSSAAAATSTRAVGSRESAARPAAVASGADSTRVGAPRAEPNAARAARGAFHFTVGGGVRHAVESVRKVPSLLNRSSQRGLAALGRTGATRAQPQHSSLPGSPARARVRPALTLPPL